MKLPFIFQCTKCNGFKNFIPDLNNFKFEQVNDDFLYHFTCPNGHKNLIIDQSLRFEILFQIGATALLDGYYREAVLSFASSLERTYEFFIKLKLLSSNIDDETYKKSWKFVDNSSERQLGAFTFLYVQHFKEYPELLKESSISFRNKVAHKGKIPTYDEAINYGNDVLKIIVNLVRKIKDSFQEEYNEYIVRELKERKDKISIENTGVIHTACMNNIINEAVNKDNMNLIDGLNSLADIKNRLALFDQNKELANLFLHAVQKINK
ncbi:hypothetical protein [Gallibacterium genomosp. 3]|uniref:hypothetical protein n=1 Tax=Gallibacterium genomosp. 3 TaxID=505345 RepID=UPI00080285B9|nr:hypothetical protein [Gallibacterium genomosp. 3]